MAWTLEKDFRFEASHQLPKHDGKCARLHGHSWRGRLICRGRQLQETGPHEAMLIDYSEMRGAIQSLLEEKLDHWHLNDSLKMQSPTSEAIAKWIYDQVKPKLPSLLAVEIEETCTSRCRYEPELISSERGA